MSPSAHDPFNFQPQHTQILAPSSPYITSHIAFKNSSFQRTPASDNIHLLDHPACADSMSTIRRLSYTRSVGLMSEARGILLGKLPHAEPQRAWPGPLYRRFTECAHVLVLSGSTHTDTNIERLRMPVLFFDLGSPFAQMPTLNVQTHSRSTSRCCAMPILA